MARGALPAVVALGLWLAGASSLAATPAVPPDRPEEGRVVYAPVPDVPLTTTRGEEVQLADLWRRRPVILTMVFASCAHICPPFLRSLERATRAEGGAGEGFDVVVVSFDPGDTVASMAALAARQGLGDRPGWTFAVTPPAEARRLAEAIGLWMRWDPRSRQFDHPAMMVAIDRGVIVRTLVGATVPPQRFREVLRELAGELVSTYPLPSDRVVFRCLSYDPTTGSLHLEWGLLLLLLPAVAMVAMVLVVFRPRPSAAASVTAPLSSAAEGRRAP